MNAQGYRWNSTGWTASRVTHPAGQYSANIRISSDHTSIRTVFVAMRDAANIENGQAYSVSVRTKNNLLSYEAKLGHEWINPRPMLCGGTGVEAFMEARKPFSGHCSQSWPGLIKRDSWTRQVPLATNADGDPGSFLIGLELQAYNTHSEKLLQGKSGVGTDLGLELRFEPTATVRAVVIDAWVQHDVLVTITPDEQMVKQS